MLGTGPKALRSHHRDILLGWQILRRRELLPQVEAPSRPQRRPRPLPSPLQEAMPLGVVLVFGGRTTRPSTTVPLSPLTRRRGSTKSSTRMTMSKIGFYWQRRSWTGQTSQRPKPSLQRSRRSQSRPWERLPLDGALGCTGIQTRSTITGSFIALMQRLARTPSSTRRMEPWRTLICPR